MTSFSGRRASESSLTIGLYNGWFGRSRGGGEMKLLALASHLTSRFRVMVISDQEIDLRAEAEYYGIDPSGIDYSFLGLPSARGVEREADERRRTLLGMLDLDVFVNMSHASTILSPVERAVYMCMFPHELDVDEPAWLSSYGAVTANSKYTAKWIERRWARRTPVVYSAAVPIPDGGAAKERVILNVGRLMPLKRQDRLVEAFARADRLLADGWQLHVVGSPDPFENEYLSSLRELCSDLPVHLHIAAPRELLIQLYGRSSIYWHAMGFGLDAEVYPGEQEHLGLTTIEAMSAACVPIVVDSGGQRETVIHGVNGFRWRSLDELIEQTERVAFDHSLRTRLSERAVVEARRFSSEVFLARTTAVIEAVIEASPSTVLDHRW